MNWLRRRRMERDLATEIQAHLAERIAELVAQGIAPGEARLIARREFGNPTLLEERGREVWRWRPIDELFGDARHAVRQLRKAPAFTLASILTLALGIGANTAVFSVVNAVILRPLPFPEPDRLVRVQSRTTRNKTPHRDNLSYPTFFDFRNLNTVFEHLSCYRDTSMGLSGGEGAINLPGLIVSWEFFDTLGVRPALGRAFLSEDEIAGQRVVVISDNLWRSRFAADPSIVGHPITLDLRPYTVVGVAPPGFNYPVGRRQVQIWTTLAVDAASDTVTPVTNQRGARMLDAIGRLKPGVSRESARAAMDTVAATLAIQYPDENKNVAGTYVTPEVEAVAGDTRAPILILLGAVALVLLIACANVANLLLARTAERSREFAVRASIGASRGRIVRQLLTEGFVFALAGAAAGILVASACLKTVVTLAASSIPRIEQAGIDGRILSFTIALAFLTSVLFSFAPAVRIARSPLAGSLKEVVPGRDRLRSALVVVQVALGLVLLSGAGLLADGFLHLVRRDVGFKTGGLLSFSVALPQPLQRGSKHLDFSSMLIERLMSLPAIESAATAAPLPLTGHEINISFAIEGQHTAQPDRPRSDMAFVSPGYFKTIGVPLLEGRLFAETDDAKGPPVLVVNRAFADKFFPGASAVGKRIEPGAIAAGVQNGMREIVGVVGNVRQDPLGAAPDPIYYYPAKQLPWCCAAYIVRVAGSPLAFEASIRQIVASLDPSAPVYEVHTLEDRLASGLAGPRFLTFLLLAFAGMALLLTVIGLYGVLTYSVLTRTREIGLRVALGAKRGEVLGMVLKEGFLMVALGTILGLAGALAGNRLASRMAFASTSPQFILLLTACLVIVSSAAMAAYFPARRAASVDPMRALRNE